ncbi:MAG: class II aldolase/adducin family protein [Lentisphaeria bacterium]|nr:class II aldolase/adducin family protein [Lentisphaeria bacterium]
MTVDYEDQRSEVAYFMRRLYRQGLTTTSGGNLSCRVGEDVVLLTASKSDKAELRADQVLLMSLDGDNLSPELVPSIESSMHLSIYRARPDVTAIVHAHPPHASAFCATRVPVNTHLTAEGYAILGDPVFVPYACMGSENLAQRVATGVKNGALCALMENHGVLAVGDSLLQAFDRLEVLELAAKHTLWVSQIGSKIELDEDRLVELDRLMGR